MTVHTASSVRRSRQLRNAKCIAMFCAFGACLLATAGMDCLAAIYGTDTTGKNFFATLDGASERPTAADTNATGTGTFTLNDAEDQLTYDVSVTGLTGDVTAAHFHFSVDGANGSGSFMLPGGTDGTITPMVVNDGNGGATAQGTIAVNAEDVSNLRLDYLYINFHTNQFSSGEVRGNIVAGQ